MSENRRCPHIRRNRHVQRRRFSAYLHHHAHGVRGGVADHKRARFMRPKRYLFLPALPKNMTGKVLKTELRALL